MDRFLFVVGQLGNGGLEKQLYYLCRQLLSENKSVAVFGWNVTQNDFYFEKFKLILGDNLLIPPPESSSLKRLFILRKHVQSFEPDSTVSFSAFTNFITSLSCIGAKTKVFGSLRTSLDFYFKKHGVKGIINIIVPNYILANSEAAITEANRRWFVPNSKMILLQNVIDIDEVNIKAKETTYPTVLGQINTISIGNIRPAKRLDRLIELFKFIKDNFPEVRINHKHLGGGDVGILNESMRKEGLADYISTLGPIENVYPYLLSSSILLHFSDVEGASNVIMEAMALGKPVISTDCGDTKLYVENGLNGYIVRPFSPRGFFEKIMKISDDSQYSQMISKNNIEKARKYDVRYLSTFFLNTITKTS